MTCFLRNFNEEYKHYEERFLNVLKIHTPTKVKLLRGNHEPHYNKSFRKAIMKTIRLKNKTNRSRNPIDIVNYKNQRNLVVSLNCQAKSRYFNEVPNSETLTPFWDTCNPYLSNKHLCRDSKDYAF